MRTTVDLPEDLLQEAKLRAARKRVTVSAVIEDAMRMAFARDAPAATNIVTLPTYGEGGLRPGVSLDDNSALLDIMEGIE
ncbi:ribbon-helix-helix domain-containing protein [Streptomyces sannanensis]|uniref:Ribbon-helix-helix domain-containing protein n=1 Tax=Streptomyces sannanensis TaxID=285536 RepID=A0ABP6SAB0_9ACTN